MGIWCFPFASEGKARGCARTLIERGFDRHRPQPTRRVSGTSRPRPTVRTMPESRSFLTGKGVTGTPFMIWQS